MKCQVVNSAVRDLSPAGYGCGIMPEKLEHEQRLWLQRVLDHTGLTPTELARRALLDHSTLSRFLTGGRDGHVLRHSTVRKIEQATGVIFGLPAETALPPRVGSMRHATGLHEAEATLLRLDDEAPQKAFVSQAVGERNNIDAWVLRSRALEGAGYLPGDVLLVELGAQARAGDVVCAQVYDWQKGTAETVFRRFEPPYLLAVTYDLKLLKPYLVDDQAVTIKGVVLPQMIRGNAA